ncbi:response regulator transcription factor [Candidatus Dojkabacteria bacterium]|uniref:Response regulator transcription factor n=1 Tax=Candidatus Dojkabacteria bacterium TaxID=2099670 RepID=A0A955HZM5_9BACT|nr:response regulator transcription factor [Candidatus Dojkabacteria bacterium]MCB9790953.1 response regulator transcription factor [Candidatus Nomurabacteria bacterium]
MKILVIEDDPVIAGNLKILLADHGYLVDLTDTGSKGIENAVVNDYDAILLDWMLPDMEGNEVCKEIRARDIKSPVIFLTAKNQVEDKVTGLDVGADDYVTKPFVIEELLARIRVQIRRNYKSDLTSEIRVGAIMIDTAKCEIFVNDNLLELPPKLYSLLEFMAVKKDTVVSRQDIIEHLWDENADVMSNVVDVHIKNLRRRLSSGGLKHVIKTVKGRGYMLCSD